MIGKPNSKPENRLNREENIPEKVINHIILLIKFEVLIKLVVAWSTKASGRGHKCCLGRVFNFKLGCFIVSVTAWQR